MRSKAFKIVYLIMFAFLLFLAVKGAMQGKGAPEELVEKIVEVKDSKVLEENEGKLVLISGKMETNDFLEFKDQGVKVKTPILERKVEMYQYMKDNQDDTRIVSMWSYEKPERILHDEKINKYYKNPDMEIESEKRYADVKLGEFTIEEDLLIKIQPDTVFKDFEISEGYRVQDETILLTAHDKNTKQIGDYRMQFSYLDLDKEEYTFLGKQENGKIKEFTLETGKKILENYKGSLNKDEVVQAFSKGEKMVKYTSFVLLGIMLIFGVFIFKPKKEVA